MVTEGGLWMRASESGRDKSFLALATSTLTSALPEVPPQPVLELLSNLLLNHNDQLMLSASLLHYYASALLRTLLSDSVHTISRIAFCSRRPFRFPITSRLLQVSWNTYLTRQFLLHWASWHPKPPSRCASFRVVLSSLLEPSGKR